LLWLTFAGSHTTPKCARGTGTSAIKAALAKDDLVAKWNVSSWGKKIVGRNIKAGLNDFQRFQARHHLKLIARAVKKQYSVLDRTSRGLGPKVAKKKKGGAKGKPAKK